MHIHHQTAMTYEYIVAMEQHGRIAFVNEEWINPLQGREPSAEDLQSCPEPHVFLNAKGAEGWDLVSVVQKTNEAGDQFTHIYLRRQIGSQNG